MHTHLTGDPSAAAIKDSHFRSARGLTGAKNARLTVGAGFTTVRNVGASGYTDVLFEMRLMLAMSKGPHDGFWPALGNYRGHCDNNLLPFDITTKRKVWQTSWAARAKVRETIKYGADLIKVCAPAAC